MPETNFAEPRIRELQLNIANEFLRDAIAASEPNFKRIATYDVELLFRLYDQHFFGQQISRCLAANRVPLTFRLSPRMTDAGGKTTYSFRRPGSREVNHFEIALSTTLLFESFQLESNQHLVAGLPCSTRLEAMQRIMEHEIVHLLELHDFGNSSCARRRFKGMSKQLFSHRESHHRLIRPVDRAKESLGIVIGDRVSFDFDGVTRVGVIHRITKRATVLVENASGLRYTDGSRYSKYYVPINQLRKSANAG